MKYHLFTAPHRCAPCRALELQLESIPNWKEHIEYINADGMSESQHDLAAKLGISRLPSFTSDDEVISSAETFKKIKEICTSE